MSVNAVIISNNEALSSIHFSNEKLNFLDSNKNDDEDEELEYDLDNGESDVLLKSGRRTDSYLVQRHSNFSSTSSLSSSSSNNSLTHNANHDLFLDAQEFAEDPLNRLRYFL